MKRIPFLLLLLAGAFAAVAQQHPLTVDDMLAMHRVGAPHLSPDGKWIAYDESTIDLGANARHSAIMLVASSGGTARQLTEGKGQDESPAWSPDGRQLAYVSDRDGGAKQVWLYDVATGNSRRLSNLQGGAGSVKWVPNGSGVVVVSDIYPDCGVDPKCINDKTVAEAAKPTHARVITSLLYRHWTAWATPTRSHVVYVPVDGSAPRDLTPGTFDAPPFSLGGGDEFEISPDSRELVFARNTDAHPEVSTNSDLFIVPLAGGEAKRITTRGGADTSPKYSPDGRWIAYRSQARAGYESDLFELWLYDRTTGQSTRLGSDFTNWIDSIAWAPDSRRMFITAPERGREAIYEVTLDGKFIRVDNEGASDALAVSPDGRTLYFDRASMTHPNDIYSISREGKVTQITHENDQRLASIAFGAVRDVTWKGADDAQIQGWLITPPGFDPAKKYPGVVLIHGGPQGAWEDSWSYRWNGQAFAARGWVVLMPNPRGSTGFGQKFVEEISGDWGGRAYIDIMNGTDMLAAMPYVDPSRLGAAGASFGGYMIDWILGHTDRFKALVQHDGTYDLRSMYGTTEELWFPEWEFHGNPWDNPELYDKWSPDRYVKNFKTPTLVVQGELDYRVPLNQGLELFTALQRRGVPSELLLFPDEGHWVLKPRNSRLWHQTVLDWLDRWLK